MFLCGSTQNLSEYQNLFSSSFSKKPTTAKKGFEMHPMNYTKTDKKVFLSVFSHIRTSFASCLPSKIDKTF